MGREGEKHLRALLIVEEVEGLPLAGHRIVVADDEPDQLLYLTTILEDNGATVFEATDRLATLLP